MLGYILNPSNQFPFKIRNQLAYLLVLIISVYIVSCQIITFYIGIAYLGKYIAQSFLERQFVAIIYACLYLTINTNPTPFSLLIFAAVSFNRLLKQFSSDLNIFSAYLVQSFLRSISSISLKALMYASLNCAATLPVNPIAKKGEPITS